MKNLLDHLTFLYGENIALQLYERTQSLMDGYRTRILLGNGELTEQDSILITYGDQVQSPNKKSLQALSAFCKEAIRSMDIKRWLFG